MINNLYFNSGDSILWRMKRKMRIYSFRLITRGIYSLLPVAIIICMLMVTISLDLHNQIKSDVNSMISHLQIHRSSLKSVLTELYSLPLYNDDKNIIQKMCSQRKYKPKRKTIVLVPYRNRLKHLKLFLSPLHQQLMNQVLYHWISYCLAKLFKKSIGILLVLI